jgi:hypothetical protein
VPKCLSFPAPGLDSFSAAASLLPLLVSSQFVVITSEGHMPGLSPILRGTCAPTGSRLLLQGLDLLLVTRGLSSFFLLVIFFSNRWLKSSRKSFPRFFVVS